jgi:arylsulfatase A-like enzyme
MDAEIGRLWSKLQELQLEDKTAVLIVGDHGEGLGEYHNDFGDPHVGHIHFLYDVYMKVPLIIRFPSGLRAGVRDEFVSLLDIAPTISRIMGFKPLPHFLGRDLLRSPLKLSGPISQETYRPESTRDRFGLLSPPWHLIFTPEDKKFEIYNLADDPLESADLYEKTGEFPSAILPLRQKIEALAREALGARPQVQVDDKTKEMLRALGYIR